MEVNSQAVTFREIPVVHVLGSKLSLCALDDLFQSLKLLIETSTPALLAYGNLHSLNLAYEQPWLRDFFNAADLVHIDGEGARLAAQIVLQNQGQPRASVPNRSTWAELGWQLAAFCEHNHFSLFLLGAAPGVADDAAARLKSQHPTLKIVGTHHGYYDMRPGSAENEKVLQQIRTAQPHILIVGFGMPRQEEWLLNNAACLPPCICWSAGAAFDYLSGNLKRGPKWMTRYGLEWLARLIIQPRYLWRRYLIGLPLFWGRFLYELCFPGGNQS